MAPLSHLLYFSLIPLFPPLFQFMNKHVTINESPSGLPEALGWPAVRSLPEWAATCVICGASDAGYCVRCAAPGGAGSGTGCSVEVHPLCARRAGWQSEQDEDGMMQVFCSHHRTDGGR